MGHGGSFGCWDRRGLHFLLLLGRVGLRGAGDLQRLQPVDLVSVDLLDVLALQLQKIWERLFRIPVLCLFMPHVGQLSAYPSVALGRSQQTVWIYKIIYSRIFVSISSLAVSP